MLHAFSCCVNSGTMSSRMSVTSPGAVPGVCLMNVADPQYVCTDHPRASTGGYTYEYRLRLSKCTRTDRCDVTRAKTKNASIRTTYPICAARLASSTPESERWTILASLVISAVPRNAATRHLESLVWSAASDAVPCERRRCRRRSSSSGHFRRRLHLRSGRVSIDERPPPSSSTVAASARWRHTTPS